jgi:hypothetical protein
MTTKTGQKGQKFLERNSGLYVIFGLLILLGNTASIIWLLAHNLPVMGAVIGFCVGFALHYVLGTVLIAKKRWGFNKNVGLSLITWGLCAAIGSGILIIPGYSRVVAVNGQYTSLGRRVMFVAPFLYNAVGVQLEQEMEVSIMIVPEWRKLGFTVEETHRFVCRFPAKEDIVLRLAGVQKSLRRDIKDELQYTATSSTIIPASDDIEVATDKTVVDAALRQILEKSQLPPDVCSLSMSERRTLTIHTVNY